MATAHQKNVATVAGGVTSVVVSAALGADPAAISTWFLGAVDGLITRIQAGYALNRRSAMGFLPRHAAISGARVTPVPGLLDVGKLRGRLHITGPVAFKRSIESGRDTEQALRSMSVQMGGVADEYVRNGDRDVMSQTMRHGRGLVGYRRRTSGKGCGFCSMLVTRGAVYSAKGANFASHPHCHCWAEPLYRHQQEPPEVRRLQRQWERITAGETGADKARAWRRHWEKATPQAQQRMGVAAARPGGATGVPAPVSEFPIRPELAQARSVAAVSRVFEAEAKRITGRDIPATLQGSVATAREHAEGLLLGLERFPDADLYEVRTAPIKATRGADPAMAEAENGVITFDLGWSSVENRQRYLDQLGRDMRNHWHPAGTGNPTAIALHEFGHIVDIETIGEVGRLEIARIVRAQAAKDGVTPKQLVAFDVSRYARDGGSRELAAESFLDVMVNGPAASQLSRDIFAVVERHYIAGGRAVGRSGAASAAGQPFTRMTVAELRAEAAARGLSTTGTKAQLVERLEGGATAPVKATKAVAKKAAPQVAETPTKVATVSRRADQVKPGDQIFVRERRSDGEIVPAGAGGRPVTVVSSQRDPDFLNSWEIRAIDADGNDVLIVATATPTKGGTGYLNDFDPIRVAVPAPVKATKAVAKKAAPKVAETPAVKAARLRQAKIDTARAQGDLAAELLEILPANPSTAALRNRITSGRFAVSDDVRTKLLATAEQGEAELRTAIGDVLGKAKVKTIGTTGDLVPFDPKIHDGAGIAKGAMVRVTRPGTTARIGREDVQLGRAKVVKASAAEIRAAEQKAQRAAARLRAAQIETATGNARLLAEIDKLLAEGAEARVIRQRLDAALIAREQIFGGADDAIRTALLAVVDDPVKLRAAVTRMSTKAKLKPVSRAGAKVKFDPATMEPVAGEIKAGVQVTVISRGASVTLPDGTVVQVVKAQVTPVVPKVKLPPGGMTKQANMRRIFRVDDPDTGLRARVGGIDKLPPDASLEGINKPGSAGGWNRVYVNIEHREFDPDDGRWHWYSAGEGLTVDISPDGRQVWHSFGIDEEFQGQGFTTRHLGNVFAEYKRLGVERILLEANNEVGGYAWARAGFQFADDAAREELIKASREYLAIRPIREKWGAAALAEFERVAANPHSQPIDFAMIGHTGGTKMWPGKELLLGSRWRGVLVL